MITSRTESRSSLAAACAVPIGAITGVTGLTANNVPLRNTPFARFCLDNWYVSKCPFKVCSVEEYADRPLPGLDELLVSA